MALSGRKRIVILGGGCGGVVAATKLGRALGSEHDVVLVDRRSYHVFMPAFLFLMVGQRKPEDIARSLENLAKRNVRFIQDEVVAIDPARQEVQLRSSKVSYDYLIVSLGLETRPDLIPGFAEGAHHAWEMEAAVKVRRVLERFHGGRVVVGVPLGPYRCPPAPYETQWMLDSYFRAKGIRDRVVIEYFTRDPEPTGEAHEPVVWMDAESKKRGIRQHYEFVVHSIDPQEKVVTGLYGYKLSYDLLFMIPPHRPPKVLEECGLADAETGVRVDYDTMETKWENVYAIGDCADMPASKAGGVAHQEADIVAHNLAVKIRQRGKPVPIRLHTI
ncbi:MAG TPA: FAD/NAD(P)-binding oxidoreductase [Candidatus Acidoferrales bacterium]|nr:FAD/NAD(P)-binding oxidoreductase [Candidatus Acidoferrales bacterium]